MTASCMLKPYRLFSQQRVIQGFHALYHAGEAKALFHVLPGGLSHLGCQIRMTQEVQCGLGQLGGVITGHDKARFTVLHDLAVAAGVRDHCRLAAGQSLQQGVGHALDH